MQQLIFTNSVGEALERLISEIAPSNCLTVITDTTVAQRVLAPIADSPSLEKANVVAIAPGDANKSLDAVVSVWQALVNAGATRHSLAVNFGGGVVTDLGGFAASTFKRGIRFINVPTTLLAAVDAAVGGKTGFNFQGLKNEIGAFREADAVIISTRFFATLPDEEMLSGYAEMLKHGLIDSPEAFRKLLAFNPLEHRADEAMLELLRESVEVKRRVVAVDPLEQGIRRALNLGHTVGHALESLALERNTPVPHGYAVAWGLVTELVLSHMGQKFPSDLLHSYATYVADHYGAPSITCSDYPRLMELMRHDKKNHDTKAVNFTLLRSPGDIVIDCYPSEADILAALDITRDLLHC